jgi:hypothetical protein
MHYFVDDAADQLLNTVRGAGVMRNRLLILSLCLLWTVPSWGQSTTARTFNGSSDSLQSASTINLASSKIISLSFWMAWTTFANTDNLAFETSENFNSHNGTLIVDPNDSSTSAFAFYSLSTGLLKCHFARPSTAVHHYLLIWDTTTPSSGTCTAYVDGVSQTVTVDINGNDGAGFGNYTLNVMSRNNASLFAAASKVSDIAIWKSALTSGNATTLAACGNPQSLSPDFYWPINQTSPEVATDGGVNLTVNGTTNSAANCTGGAASGNGPLILMGIGK